MKNKNMNRARILVFAISGVTVLTAAVMVYLVCVFMMMVGIDPNYNVIYDGSWLNDEPYAVIHRIATTVHGKGIAEMCYDFALAHCNNLRIDTSSENYPMQKSLLKNGFKLCGVIHLANGDPRLAYHKSI